jgi:hypothetical protein
MGHNLMMLVLTLLEEKQWKTIETNEKLQVDGVDGP